MQQELDKAADVVGSKIKVWRRAHKGLYRGWEELKASSPRLRPRDSRRHAVERGWAPRRFRISSNILLVYST